MRKADIEYHSDHGCGVPAVNVKIGWLSDLAWEGLARTVAVDHGDDFPAEFTLGWIREALSQDEQDQYWQIACDQGWEQLQDDAREIWQRPKLEIYSQGRSSGWAVVGKLYDGEDGRQGFTRESVDGWDAIAVAKWARFCKIAREIADDVPYQYLSLIYLNRFCAAGEPRTVKTWQAEGGDQA